MPKLSRVTDTNEVGGQIVRGASTVIANGLPVGLHGSPITPHSRFRKQHLSASTTSGSPNVVAEGSPVLRVGSGNSCGHSISTGSPNIEVT
jgi:uncharacterized Zn-binding protein involved in type VI secretion